MSRLCILKPLLSLHITRSSSTRPYSQRRLNQYFLIGIMAPTPSYHMLDFFYDNEDSCALTITRNSVRFHIIADAKRLKNESDAEEGREYFSLMQSLRDSDRSEDEQTSIDSGIDVQSPRTTESESKQSGTTFEDAQEKLHKWM